MNSSFKKKSLPRGSSKTILNHHRRRHHQHHHHPLLVSQINNKKNPQLIFSDSNHNSNNYYSNHDQCLPKSPLISSSFHFLSKIFSLKFRSSLMMMMIPMMMIIILLSSTTVLEARNYRHVPEELALTNQVVLNQRDCTPDETPIFIHTAAVNSGKYYERRMTIRRTWGREAAKYKMRLLFVIGVPRNLIIERQLKAESDKYGDILQFNFIEDYYNLTLKAIAELKWAYRHCRNSRYMVKTDDDVVMNMPMLYQLVQRQKIPSGLTGLVMTTPANRQPGHKWYMPRRYYHKESYEFLAGFSYLLSMDRLKQFLKTIITYPGPILDIDDLFLTGIVADYGRIKRNNSFRFKFFCGLDLCTMEQSLVMHACSDARNSETMYRVWKQSDTNSCYANLRLNRNRARRRGRRAAENLDGSSWLGDEALVGGFYFIAPDNKEMIKKMKAEQTIHDSR